MISIIIPTLNAETHLAASLNALVLAAADGLVREVIVADGGSVDRTLDIAGDFGARIITSPPGRGGQMAAGAKAARGEWLLFIHCDTFLEDSWAHEVDAFIKEGGAGIGVFTLSFDVKGIAPRLVAGGAMLRTKILKSPYGDQGLFIARSLYDEIAGFKDMPLFEDVDIIQRIIAKKGSDALRVFKAKAVTSAARYEREGYLRRVLKNALLLMRYRLGASPEKLAEAYR